MLFFIIISTRVLNILINNFLYLFTLEIISLKKTLLKLNEFYIRGADLAFARKDIEDTDVDEKLNELKSQCTLEIWSIFDKLSHGIGRKTVVILSLSEQYLVGDFEEAEIPFFFASDRINQIITL